jgi:predicted nuclease with TOPRIM domain
MSKELKKFKEDLGGFFHQMLRASGVTMVRGDTHEKVRDIGERMASSIVRAAELKSIEVVKKLQSAVSEAFDKTQDELDNLKKRVDQLEEERAREARNRPVY